MAFRTGQRLETLLPAIQQVLGGEPLPVVTEGTGTRDKISPVSQRPLKTAEGVTYA